MNRSSKKLLTGVLLLLVLMTLPGVALAGSQDFTLINRSPFRIVGFWVAPANSDNWEENLLEGDAVAPNSSIDITFDNTNNVRWWNFRIKDSSGKTWNWEKSPTTNWSTWKSSLAVHRVMCLRHCKTLNCLR